MKFRKIWQTGSKYLVKDIYLKKLPSQTVLFHDVSVLLLPPPPTPLRRILPRVDYIGMCGFSLKKGIDFDHFGLKWVFFTLGTGKIVGPPIQY